MSIPEKGSNDEGSEVLSIAQMLRDFEEDGNGEETEETESGANDGECLEPLERICLSL